MAPLSQVRRALALMFVLSAVPGCTGRVEDAAGTAGTPPPSVPATPAIVTQPTDQTTAAGATVTFAVVASGAALEYQWNRDGAPLAGATGASYRTGTLARGDSGATFAVTIRNG